MTQLKNPETEIERLRKTGRNDECPCGSGKKYKKCHLREDEEAERSYLSALREKQEAEAAAQAEAEHDEHDGHDHSAHPSTGSGQAPSKGVSKAGKVVPKATGASVANAQRSMPRKAQ